MYVHPISTLRLTAMISIIIVPSAVRSALEMRNVPRSMVLGLGVIVTPLMRIIRSRLPHQQPHAAALCLPGTRVEHEASELATVDLQHDTGFACALCAALDPLHPGRVADGLVHGPVHGVLDGPAARQDRKSTRLNSSHVKTAYAVCC